MYLHRATAWISVIVGGNINNRNHLFSSNLFQAVLFKYLLLEKFSTEKLSDKLTRNLNNKIGFLKILMILSISSYNTFQFITKKYGCVFKNRKVIKLLKVVKCENASRNVCQNRKVKKDIVF